MERPEVVQFKLLSSLTYRVEKAAKMKKSHEGCCPVVILKDPRCKFVFEPTAYALSGSMSLGSLISKLRVKFSLPPSEGIFLYIEEFIPSMCKSYIAFLIHDLYVRFSDPDGFLYLVLQAQPDKGFDELNSNGFLSGLFLC